MKNAFIAIALLLVASSAFASLSAQTKARLHKVNSNAFGKTILETIQVELQSKDDPRPRIMNLLQELEQEIIADQSNADAAHQNDVDTDAALQQQINDELASLAEDLSEWNSNEADWSAQLSQDEADLATNEDLLAAYNAELDAATAAREANQALWEAGDAKYGRILDVLGQVRGVITTRLASRYNSEFIQSTHKEIMKSFVQVKEHIASKSFKKLSPGFSKLAAFLAVKVENALNAAGPTAEDDEAEAALTSIVTLIDSITAGVEEERTSATLFNEEDTEAFEATRTRLEASISSTQANIDNLNNEITDLEGRLATVAQDIATAEARVDELNESLLVQQASIAQLNEAYATTTHDRNEQLALIQEVIDIVQNQLTGLRQYAEDYLGSH